MKNDLVLYVDFDSTLYDTSLFAEKLWKLLADKASLSIDTVRRDSGQFYFHPYLGGYEYDAHFTSYGLDSNDMWQALDTITDCPDYLYPDSVKFIDSLRSEGFAPQILTFGEDRFQRAKINPILKYLSSPHFPSPLKITIVDKKKNQHISALHPGQKGVLVDDKPDQHLPVGFVEIHLDRKAIYEGAQKTENIFVAHDLPQVFEIIKSI